MIEFLFECSRCEQDGRLTRNGSYYGSCVDGIPQRVPCTVERETIAWNGHELHSTIVDCTRCVQLIADCLRSFPNEIMENFKWQWELLNVCLAASRTQLHCSLRPFIVLYIIEFFYYFVFDNLYFIHDTNTHTHTISHLLIRISTTLNPFLEEKSYLIHRTQPSQTKPINWYKYKLNHHW